MTAEVVVILTTDEARALTERIKVATHNLAAMLKEAHDKEAWRALGYSSWNRYVDTEFQISESRSYRLLSAARIEEELSAQLGAPVTVKERAVRPLAGSVNLVVHEAMANQVGGMTLQRAVDEAVRSVTRALPLKDKPARRSIRDKTAVINAVSAAVDNFEAKSEGYSDEEVAAYLSQDERRALERAVAKAGVFAEHWGELLNRPVDHAMLRGEG